MRILLLIATMVLISCDRDKPEESFPEWQYQMKAKIDNTWWEVSGINNVRFSTEFDYSDNRFRIHINGNNLFCDPPNDYGKKISFEFDFVPVPGRYYFNNEGSVNLNNGIIAIYTFWNVNHHASKWSSDGYIDIATIARNEITGTFSFKAVGDAQNSDTTVISDGIFNAIYGGGTGQLWPGPN